MFPCLPLFQKGDSMEQIKRDITEIAHKLADLEEYADEYLVNPRMKKSYEEKVEYWKRWLSKQEVKDGKR